MSRLNLKMSVSYKPNHQLNRQVMAATLPPLERMSAYARKVAQNSLKSRPGKTKSGKRSTPAPAGTPPHSLRNDEPSKSHRIKKHIAYEKLTMTSFAVGPRVLTPQSRTVTTPELHEYGGTVVTKVYRNTLENKRRVHRAGKGTATPAQAAAYRELLESGELKRMETKDKIYEWRSVTYPARPYMEPAGGKAMAQLPQFFKNFLDRNR